MKLWNSEPALIYAAIQAVLGLVLAFGLDLSNEQTGSILALTAAVLGLATRSRVEPIEA